jgi:hypothetical protein
MQQEAERTAAIADQAGCVGGHDKGPSNHGQAGRYLRRGMWRGIAAQFCPSGPGAVNLLASSRRAFAIMLV